jgi:hypothetical protein
VQSSTALSNTLLSHSSPPELVPSAFFRFCLPPGNVTKIDSEAISPGVPASLASVRLTHLRYFVLYFEFQINAVQAGLRMLAFSDFHPFMPHHIIILQVFRSALFTA